MKEKVKFPLRTLDGHLIDTGLPPGNPLQIFRNFSPGFFGSRILTKKSLGKFHSQRKIKSISILNFSSEVSILTFQKISSIRTRIIYRREILQRMCRGLPPGKKIEEIWAKKLGKLHLIDGTLFYVTTYQGFTVQKIAVLPKPILCTKWHKFTMLFYCKKMKTSSSSFHPFYHWLEL